MRRDVEASSVAACKYLAELHNIYKDWPKTITAFRIGAIRLNQAIRLAGNSLDFNDIYAQLTPEEKEAGGQQKTFKDKDQNDVIMKLVKKPEPVEDEVSKMKKEGWVEGELTPEEKEAGGEQRTFKDKDQKDVTMKKVKQVSSVDNSVYESVATRFRKAWK